MPPRKRPNRPNLDSRKRRGIGVYVSPYAETRLRGVAKRLGLVNAGRGSLGGLMEWLGHNTHYVFTEHCRIPYLPEGEFFCASGRCLDAAQIPRSCTVRTSISQCASHCKRKEPCPCREPASMDRMHWYRAWMKRRNG